MSSRLLPVLLVSLLAGLVSLTGCSTGHSSKFGSVDLREFKNFYVVSSLADEHGIDTLLSAEFKKRGYESDYGPITMMPEKGVDAIVEYEARWAWDFRTYLIEVNMKIRHPYTRRLLGTARYSHKALNTMEPAEVVQNALDQLFNQNKAAN